MTLRLLLDTNVISDFVRGDPKVMRRLRGVAPDAIAVSTVTEMEIRYGLAIDPARTRRIAPTIDALLDAVTLVELSREDARAAGEIRAALRRRGQPIGPYDVLLAGTALARGLRLVTANVREFSRVSGLTVESWR